VQFSPSFGSPTFFVVTLTPLLNFASHRLSPGELVVFWSFGLIQLVVTALPSPRHYPYGELAYQIMSLVSKGLLGIILIANILMLSSYADVYNR